MRIGRYAVERELGRGGMGIVYEATDAAIGRRVAIKVINLQYLTGEGEAQVLRERLFREARSAGALSHPGIVVIYDVGEDREMAFIAMEYVDGPPLQQVLQSGRKLETTEVVDILRQIAGALDYAHQNGVVHRDIKPPNIMLHKGSQVKIADFGIAKITTAPKYTATGLVMGTPAYMSPEQIEGRDVDGRSDQFSLAVVAYEVLTGMVPFQGATYASMVHSIVYGQRPSARAANPRLPASVDGVFARAMAAAPQDRFANCTEFAAALDNALSATVTMPAGPVAASPSPSPVAVGGRKILTIVAVALLLVLALAGAVVYRFWPMLQNRTGRQSPEAQSSVGGKSPAPPTPQNEPRKAPDASVPKVTTPGETAKTSAKVQPPVRADQEPARHPSEAERQPAVTVPVSVSQPPTTLTLSVKSDQAWNDTGIVLRAGDTASIVARGTIRVAADKRLAVQQPGGFYPNCGRARELFGQPLGAVPAPGLSCWSLIGRVGPQGAIFEVGVQGQAPAGSAGRLFLGVNDDDYTDNSGVWSAVITVEHH
jgi:serine/threonine-protein kinase